MRKLIIKGALYFDGSEILRPHYTGEFTAVDCNSYKTKQEIKDNYPKEFYKDATGKDAEYIKKDGVKYYRCEWGPYHTENMYLISDLNLADLSYHDTETEF